MKAAVIGSGAGGLAAAIRLASKGYEVTVFEKNGLPGGKLSQLRQEGFRFDTGPSLFTLPELAEELFSLCGEDISVRLPYKPLEINCRYFYPDGTVFDFYRDPVRLQQEMEEKKLADPQALFRRLRKSAEVYRLGAPVFLFSSFRRLSDFNTAPYKKMALQLYKLDFFRTMHRANRHDFSDSRLVRIFDRYATYNGSDPFRAPATLNMIAHLENNIGAFFPEKGMYALAEELYRLALLQGVRFRFNTPVTEIITGDKNSGERQADNARKAGNGKESRRQKNKRGFPGINASRRYVRGIRTAFTEEAFDIIVSDADVKQLSRSLLPDHPLKNRLERQEPSSSALIFYWGMNRRFPRLELHNILFSDDYKTEFRKLFREKTISDDPTVYIFISSKQVKSDAPAGCENWFVMVNAPADRGQDWPDLIRRTRQHILRKTGRMLGTEIEPCIVTESVLSPPGIAARTGSVHGALYGASSNSMFSAFLRHPNFLKKIPNLYFVGGSVHPGGGLPLCLASAKIVEKEITGLHA